MVKDRLQELLSVSTATNDREYTAIPMTENVNQFLQKVADAREAIKNIQSDTDRMRFLYNETAFNASKAIQDEINSLLTSSMEKINSSAQMIKDIERSMDTNSETEQRIRSIQYNGLIKLFKDVTLDNSRFLESYKANQRSLFIQQARITKRNITQEEIEDMLEGGNIAMFSDNILASTELAKQNLADMEIRHKELLKIESNIRELRDMFVKMGELISLQQETVDRIESYAVKTTLYVGIGKNEIQEGYIYMSKAKRKKYMLLVVVLIVAIILLIILDYFY